MSTDADVGRNQYGTSKNNHPTRRNGGKIIWMCTHTEYNERWGGETRYIDVFS